MDQEARPIDDLKDVPEGLSDEEKIAFLEKHGVSENFLANTEEVPEDERPRPRTRPINVRFDEFTLVRLKQLADRRNVGYQTLLKDFVVERLYEEEKREGLLPAGQTQEVQTPADKKGSPKLRDWQSRAYKYVEEHEELLRDPELDAITSGRLADNATSMLLELSDAIREAGATRGFPPTVLRRMMKGYERLKGFCEQVLDLHKERFGDLEDDLEQRRTEAESNVIPFRSRAV